MFIEDKKAAQILTVVRDLTVSKGEEVDSAFNRAITVLENDTAIKAPDTAIKAPFSCNGCMHAKWGPLGEQTPGSSANFPCVDCCRGKRDRWGNR